MTPIQFSRRLAVAILLCLAVLGALVRHFAPDPSLLRDFGTLLMVLWVPVVGNIIAFVVGRARRGAAPPAPEPGFAADAPFRPQLQAEIRLPEPALPSQPRRVAPGCYACVLLLGSEGFRARWQVAAGAELLRGQPSAHALEFLLPATALPRFAPGTSFRIVSGDTVIGDGKVLRVLAPA